MATGILSLVATLLGILFWWLKRSAAKAADPIEQNKNRYAQIDKEIASGNSGDLTIGGGADLDELDRLQRARGGELGSKGNNGPVQ